MLTYPHARIEDVKDSLAGVSFPDPYRWMEEDSAEVRRWQHAQAELAGAYVRDWAHFDRLRQLVAMFHTPKQVALPRYAAGQWFRIDREDGSSRSQVCVAAEPMGAGRTLFDSALDDSSPHAFVSWISPSPDGRILALGVCADGSENNTIRLVNVTTGQAVTDPPTEKLMDNWTGGVQWLKDSSGFFFSALTGSGVDFAQQVYLHRLFPQRETAAVEVDWTQAHDYRMVALSNDGHHAVAIERLLNPIPVAIAEIGAGPLKWRPFITCVDATVAGHLLGDRYVAVTDVDAPRGRLVSIPLDAADPNDARCWRELVPESDAVLRTVAPIGDELYLTQLVDTYSCLRRVDLDGKVLGAVPLPGRGALLEQPYPLMNLVPNGHPDKFLFGFSSLSVSPGIYCHTPHQQDLATLKRPQLQVENVVVEDLWATSADGTRVPYHLMRGADVGCGERRPTLIYAYGGYNDPFVPKFPGCLAAFVAAGGILVHAHLRGGGEFGLDGWRGGRMGNKQNGYDDLYAVAEHLIETKRCTSQSLAVTGRSNGGLMAAIAVLQRPELWAAAVPVVPLLDLIGACRDAYGRQGILEELADVNDPAEVRRLATFSPYHLVHEGVPYPAVFVVAGDADPRCPPWHARKFTARLQQATATDAPILMHVWEGVGHSGAADKPASIDEFTEWLAFVLRQTGAAGVTRHC